MNSQYPNDEYIPVGIPADPLPAYNFASGYNYYQ